MSRKYHQGRFVPRNPDKYNGNVNNIVYRSGWERVAFNFCDLNTNIVQWASEETVIGYLNPVSNTYRRYYVDLKITVKLADETYKTFLVEIKPYAETVAPRKGKNLKSYAYRVRTFVTNMAKWAAARAYCKKHGYEFIIWTERELFPKKN